MIAVIDVMLKTTMLLFIADLGASRHVLSNVRLFHWLDLDI